MDAITILLCTIPLIVVIAILLIVLKTTTEGKGKIIAITISCTIGIILFASVLVPILSSSITQIDSFTTMNYDDYYPTYATESSGSVELINVNGESYAHAIDIGDGTLTYSNGSIKNITVTKSNLDVFMFLGQSNIAYWTSKTIDGVRYNHVDLQTVSPKIGLGNVYYYGRSYMPYDNNNDGTNNDIYDMNDSLTGLPKVGNLDYSFASAWALKNHVKTLIVNCGWSGTAISHYVPDGYVYDHAKLGWNDAISKIDTDHFNFTIKGYVFCQGEGDSGTSVTTYKTRFMSMHNAIIGNDSDNVFSDNPPTVCYLDLPRTAVAENPVIAQLELAKNYDSIVIGTEIANTFTIQNQKLMLDNLHYTQIGQNSIAKDLVKNMKGI